MAVEVDVESAGESRRAPRQHERGHVTIASDGVRDESQQSSNAFFDAEAAEGGTLDLRPDFVFDSRGRLTDSGYEIEVRIPFQSIRFQSAERQDWGINVVREVQHAGQTQTWTAARRGETSFLAQSGRLVGLYALDRGLVLDPGGFGLSVAEIGANGVSEDDILRHDETNVLLAHALAALGPPDFPMVMGVLYCAPAETFEAAVHRQIAAAGPSARKPDPADDILALLHAGDTWEVR